MIKNMWEITHFTQNINLTWRYIRTNKQKIRMTEQVLSVKLFSNLPHTY